MYIASASSSVKFHSIPEGELVYNYQPGPRADGNVRGISWSKDGSWLSIVPRKGPPEIISIKNQLRLIHTVVDMDIEDPSSTAFQNTTKKFVAYGTRTGQVLIYDVKQKRIRNRFPRGPTMISHIEFTTRDSHLVAGCLSGEILVYNSLTQALSTTLRVPKSRSVTALRTNPIKRNILIAGSNEGVVVVWDTNTNKHKFLHEVHKAPVTGVSFSPNNPDLIITTGQDRQFCCYDILSQKCIASVPVDFSTMAVDFSHDGTHFALASYEGNISLYDSRKILEPIHVFEAHKGGIEKIAFQKQEMVSANSSILDEGAPPEQPVVQEEDINVSFRNLLRTTSSETGEPDCDNAYGPVNAVDSFMAGLGFNRESLGKYEQSTNGDGDNRQTENTTEEPKRLSLYKRRSLSIKQASTSTPNCPQIATSKIEAPVSPIINTIITDANGNTNNIEVPVSLNQIEKLLEDVVERKLTEKFTCFAQEIKHQFANTNQQIRRMLLDVMMSNMKHFIGLEDGMKAMRDDFATNSPLSENYLLEENLKLKKYIENLERRLTQRDLED